MNRSLQMRYGALRISPLAVVNPQKELRARQARLQLDSLFEHCDGIRAAALKLIDEPQVHVGFRKAGSETCNPAIFLPGSRVVLVLLGLLGRSPSRLGSRRQFRVRLLPRSRHG